MVPSITGWCKTGAKGTPGIDGGHFLREGPVGHVNTIDVPSIDEFLSKIEAHRGNGRPAQAGGSPASAGMPMPRIPRAASSVSCRPIATAG